MIWEVSKRLRPIASYEPPVAKTHELWRRLLLRVLDWCCPVDIHFYFVLIYRHAAYHIDDMQLSVSVHSSAPFKPPLAGAGGHGTSLELWAAQ
eukprot:7965856-Prorocentrum_lima.AAC.1